ncbi:hypothetical protein OS175_01800 [Marinicella sp. S1101]|uniref:hypothetical protein n=1 Tax=Marinicella marina TaxID=2996016 RepID=UPI002260F255|nr:hypothetical protein [Marinicella marina]MCX7552597.1 hypothetical protein [Marinicella marina]MDJ1139473.1 hypothetical protein [Marinicella marina]
MFKKYLRCFVVSLVLSLMLPILSVDMYSSPTEYESSSSVVQINGEEVLVHETADVGIIDKIKFYFSSKTSFAYYIKMVIVWFLAMFVASSLSTYLNRKN